MTPRGFRAPPTTTGDKVSPEHAIADMADEESSEVMRALTDHVDTCVTPFEKTVMSSNPLSNLYDKGVEYPELHFARAVLSIWLTLVGCFFITLFANPTVLRDNVFVERLGYSNVCVGIDTEPAVYVAALGLQIFCYFNIRYAMADKERSDAIWSHNKRLGMGHKNNRWRYRFYVGTDFVYVLSSMTFSGTVLMRVPDHSHDADPAQLDDDVWVHTMVYIQWIFALLLMLTANYLENSAKNSRDSNIFMAVYFVFSLALPLNTIVNYVVYDRTGEYLTNNKFSAFLDFGWLALTTFHSWYLPVGDAIVTKRYVRIVDVDQDLKKNMDQQNSLAQPSAAYGTLFLLMVPFALCSATCHFVAGACRRMARLVGLLPRATPVVSSSSTSSSSSSSSSKTPSPAALPVKTAYFGDIFGWIAYGANPGIGRGGYTEPRHRRYADKNGGDQGGKSERYGPIRAMNLGVPAVGCMDLGSARHFLELDRRVEGAKLGIPFFRYDSGENAAQPNFMRGGDHGYRIRRFLQDLLPADGPADPAFKSASRYIGQRISKWTTFRDEDLSTFDVETEFAKNLMTLFISHLLLGVPADTTFLENIFPIPQVRPLYPWFPEWLDPMTRRMKRAKTAMWTFMRHCPNATKIEEARRRHGLDEIEAFETLIAAMTINAGGAGNSMLNMALLLPLTPRDELRRDPVLLESFCWELLRNGGASFTHQLVADDAVTSSEGESYRLKKGTLLMTNYAACNRDATAWSDPDVFKIDRFKPKPPVNLAARTAEGMEPLPVVTFGCALGKLDDKEYNEHSTNCVFKHLAVPFMMEVAKHLLEHNYEFTEDVRDALHRLSLTNNLDASAGGGALEAGVGARAAALPKKSKCPFAFDISPNTQRGGMDPYTDLTPKLYAEIRFSRFRLRDGDAKDVYHHNPLSRAKTFG